MVKVDVYQLTEDAREYWFMGSIMGKNCIYRENASGRLCVPIEKYKYIGTVEVSETVGKPDEYYAELVFSNDQFGGYPFLLHKNEERTTSISDVFAITKNNECHTYFVDSIGWTPVKFTAKEDWEKFCPMEKGKIRNLSVKEDTKDA